MTYWKIPTLGITSDDFMRHGSQNLPMETYGQYWRYANDQDANPSQKAEVAARMQTQAPLSNELVDQAKEMGQPVPMPDTIQVPEGAVKGFSEAQLQKLPKEQLVEVASALGIANLEQSKAKLIEAILEKQVA